MNAFNVSYMGYTKTHGWLNRQIIIVDDNEFGKNILSIFIETFVKSLKKHQPKIEQIKNLGSCIVKK